MKPNFSLGSTVSSLDAQVSAGTPHPGTTRGVTQQWAAQRELWAAASGPWLAIPCESSRTRYRHLLRYPAELVTSTVSPHGGTKDTERLPSFATVHESLKKPQDYTHHISVSQPKASATGHRD